MKETNGLKLCKGKYSRGQCWKAVASELSVYQTLHIRWETVAGNTTQKGTLNHINFSSLMIYFSDFYINRNKKNLNLSSGESN